MIILIADDDRLIRFTIKSMLGEILACEYRILEAKNGAEMVEMCKKHLPDIVFADIKMPCMNGLDAIEECRKSAPDTEFVVISGYSDFSYAQRGIRLGIHEYILKPVEKEKLAEIMETLEKKLQSRKRASNSAFQLKVLDTFNYFSTVGIEAEFEEFLLPGDYQYLVFGLFAGYAKKNQERYGAFLKEYIRRVQKIGQKMIDRKGYYSLVYSAEGTPCFIFCVKKQDGEEILFHMRRTAGTMGEEKVFHVAEYFYADTLRKVYQMTEVIDQYACVVMQYPGACVRPAKSRIPQTAEYEILKLTEKILKSWEHLDEIGYMDSINTMYRCYKDQALELSLLPLAAYCSCVTGREISGGSFKSFCRSFIDISDGMYENSEEQDGDVIGQVKDYIVKYYMNDISISYLAEQYGLTPNYLSTLFHQRAGCRFMEYLTDVRISNAKRLLVLNATASVQDIAVLVGYNSSRHFSALFQKQTGLTPSVYRKEKSTKDSDSVEIRT